MVTHISFPTAYHISKEGNIRECEINEERHIILKLMMICARGFLAKFLMGTFVILTTQPKFLHVFNTLLEGSCLLAYSSLTDVAVEVTLKSASNLNRNLNRSKELEHYAS